MFFGNLDAAVYGFLLPPAAPVIALSVVAPPPPRAVTEPCEAIELKVGSVRTPPRADWAPPWFAFLV